MTAAFRPDLRLPSDLSEQTGLEDKFGGKPWGIPVEMWPRCSECDEAMSFLCQIKHEPQRADLGRDGRVVYLFMCNHNPGMCETWDQDSGANAVVIVEPEKLTNSLTSPPSAAEEEAEFRVVAWVESKVEEEWATHVGGVPLFVQGEDEAPPPPFRYILHFADQHFFLDGEETPIPGPNFGDAGCGYLYVRTAGNPEGKFFWQCG
jgi:hypothetical protein